MALKAPLSLVDQLKALELQIQQIRCHVEEETTKSPKQNKLTVKNPAKQRSKERKPSAHDISALLHLPEALQENILQFTRSLDLNADTDLLDELYQERCITEDDYHAIRRRVASDQVRYLVIKVKCRPPTVIQKFLDILKDRKYDHIVNKILASRDKLRLDRSKKITCVICVLKTMVDIKDIADYMWKEKILESDMYHNLVVSDNPQQYRRQFWEHVTIAIDEKRVDLTSLARVMDNVGYDHIGNYMKELPRGSKLECCCMCRKQPQPKSDRESVISTQSEFSTTSEVPRSNRDSMLSDIDDGILFRKQDRTRRHRQIKETNELLKKKTVSDIIREVETEHDLTATQSDVNIGQLGVNEQFESSTETLRPPSVFADDDGDQTFVKVISMQGESRESSINDETTLYKRVAPELCTHERALLQSTGHVSRTSISQDHLSVRKSREETELKMVCRHQSTGYIPSDELGEDYTTQEPADGLDYPDSSVRMRHVSVTPTPDQLQMGTQNMSPVRQRICTFERIAHTGRHTDGKNPEALSLPRHSSTIHYVHDWGNTNKRWKSETFLILQKNQNLEAVIDKPIPAGGHEPHKSPQPAYAYVNWCGIRPDSGSLVNTVPVTTRTEDTTKVAARTDNINKVGVQNEDDTCTGVRSKNKANTGVRTDDNIITGVRIDDSANAGVRTEENTNMGVRTDKNTNMGVRTDENANEGLRTDYNANPGAITKCTDNQESMYSQTCVEQPGKGDTKNGC